MKRFGLMAVSLPVLLTGCAAMLGFGHTKVYDGIELPVDKISIIEKHPGNGYGMGVGIWITGIDEKEVSRFSMTKLEVLPGKRLIKGSCDNKSNKRMANNLSVSESGLSIDSAPEYFDLQPGVHYKMAGQIIHLPTHQWTYKKDVNFLGHPTGTTTVTTKLCRLLIKEIGKVQPREG